MKNHNKNSLLLIILISTIYCNQSNSNSNADAEVAVGKKVEIRLVDSLGTIYISVPSRFDTSFVWVSQSDCGKPCEVQKYRFQPKKLPVFKESGFYVMNAPKDSVDQFTISHPSYLYNRSDTIRDTYMHSRLKAEMEYNSGSFPMIFDTIQKIGNRYYSIFYLKKKAEVERKRVLAVTTIKGNEIRFQYELASKTGDTSSIDFFQNSMKYLETIEIKAGTLIIK